MDVMFWQFITVHSTNVVHENTGVGRNARMDGSRYSGFDRLVCSIFV